MIEYQVMSHVFPEKFIEISQAVHFSKRIKVLITIVSSNIKEVTRAILNFFIHKFHNHKNTQNAYKQTKTKNVPAKHLRGK